LEELFELLQARKAQPKVGSYTVQLLAAGEDEIIKKVGEEAVEVILAAKAQGDARLIEETADLLYHLLVLLVARDIAWELVLQELARRRQTAGEETEQ
jgi:phosphoribosyl-ATP pyrophosphohydrolase